jgi:hypothetical protein
LIAALIENVNAQKIDLGEVHDYYSLFKYLTATCPAENTLHISWKCFASGDGICEDIKSRRDELKMKILEKDDKETQVKMKLFENVEVVTNKGDTRERLELRQNKSLAAEIIAFIDTFLFKLIFH